MLQIHSASIAKPHVNRRRRIDGKIKAQARVSPFATRLSSQTPTGFARDAEIERQSDKMARVNLGPTSAMLEYG
jgi:hypothetical protein